MNCRAYAKALHYKELEFHKGPNSKILESLIRCVCLFVCLILFILGDPLAKEGYFSWAPVNIQKLQ